MQLYLAWVGHFFFKGMLFSTLARCQVSKTNFAVPSLDYVPFLMPQQQQLHSQIKRKKEKKKKNTKLITQQSLHIWGTTVGN